jgi:predicted component of type VI protein secretion system
MANTYTWKINQLDAKIKEGNLDNFIYNIHWTLSAEDDNPDISKKIRAVDVGCTELKLDPESPFIPYSDLKKDDVIGWLDNVLNFDQMKLALDKAIESQKNPVDEYLHPDWDDQ